jgi:hypothetical protein
MLLIVPIVPLIPWIVGGIGTLLGGGGAIYAAKKSAEAAKRNAKATEYAADAPLRMAKMSLRVFLIVVCGALVVGIIWIPVNFFFVPQKAQRYIPESAVAVSYDGHEPAELRGIVLDKPFYLQVRLSVKSNSITRNLFSNNKIPVIVEVSNVGNSVISEPQNLQFCKEEKPSKTIDGKRIYYFTVLAAKSPQTSILEFNVLPTRTGTQTVSVTYGKKVSDVYTKAVTLEYK